MAERFKIINKIETSNIEESESPSRFKVLKKVDDSSQPIIKSTDANADGAIDVRDLVRAKKVTAESQGAVKNHNEQMTGTVKERLFEQSKLTQLKNEMDKAEKKYKDAQKTFNVNPIQKDFAVLGSDDKKVGPYKDAYENKKKEYETYKATLYYSSLPDGEIRTTNSNKEEFGSNIFSKVDWKYEYINNINDVQNMIDGTMQADEVNNEFIKYRYMDEREKGIYNYLYQTKGKKEAEHFLQFINDTLNERHSNKELQNSADFASKHPFAAAAISIPMNIGSSTEQIANMGKYLITGEMEKNLSAEKSSILRGRLSDKVNLEIGNWDAFDFVYNTVMSGVDSLVVAPLGAVGAVSLGLSAAASTTNDILERGGTKEQAFWGGIAAGTFEGFFESFSIGKLLDDVEVKGFKDFAKNMGINILVNASEETATEVANVLYDYAANGGISHYALLVEEYMQDPNIDEKTAKKKAAQKLGLQILEAGASGALMGAGFGAMNSASGYRNYKINKNKGYITLEEFANSNSEIWRNVDYSDNETKTEIMNETHNRMVAEDLIVKVPSETLKKVEESYPDLRSMKKKERAPILKEAVNVLKNNLRQFLNGFKNQGFDFRVNGKVLEAKLYNTGINEVLEKITQEKANMLYSTEEIFKNSCYLYSTPDYDGDPNVYRWNYFYTPVQIGEETMGVRIAVRDVATPSESQIYNWGIKKDASLDGVRRGNDRISHDVSSDTSFNPTIPQNGSGVNNNISNSGENDSSNLQSSANSDTVGAVDTASSESGERSGFTEPTTKEIFRDSTLEDRMTDRDAKQRHITDVAKKLDKDMTIMWVEKGSDKLGGKNGKYVRSTNTMYLAKDMTVVEMYVEVFKHEFVHRLESRKAYIAFKDYLVNRSTAFENYARGQLNIANGEVFDGTRQEVIKAISEQYYNRFVNDRTIAKPTRDKFTMEDAEREVVADFVGEVLFKGKENRLKIAQALSEEGQADIFKEIGNIEGSVDFFTEIARDNRNLLQKFIDVIKDFIANLKGLKQNERLVNDLGYIEERLARVYASKDTKKAADKSAVEQFSRNINLKITQSMSDDNRAKILKNKKITNIKSIKELSNDILQKFSEISSWDDINNIFGKNKSNIIKKIASEFDVFKKYSNSDINVEFEFSNNNFRESYHKQKTNYEQFAKMFSVFDDVINSAVGIEVHKREKYKPDPTLENVYVLMSAFEDGELIVPVKLEIKEFKDKQNTLYVAISLEGIKKAEVSKQGTTENGVAQNSRSATISICDLISKINPKDANFLKYIPNQLLNNEQIEAKNKILEDGSFSSGSPMQQARENLTRYENGEITREEYLEENDRLWGEANEKYGIIKQGENSQTPTPIAVPQAVADDKPTEHFVRTILETGKLTDEMVENTEAQILLGNFSYKVSSDESAIKKADFAIERGTAEDTWNEVVNTKNRITKNDIAIGERLLTAAIYSGNTLRVLELSSELADIFTRAGQVVQAARLLKKMTGAGRLVSLQRTVKTLNKDLVKKYGEKAPEIKIDPRIAEMLAKAVSEKGIEHAYQEVLTDIASQMPVTLLDKWNAWRYFAMLSNPKTHIRNFVGNTIFMPTVRIKNVLAYSMEATATKAGLIENSDRTKSLIIKKEYAEFAKRDGQRDAVKRMLKGNKYNDKSALKEKQKIFENAALEFITSFNSNALEAEDMLFKNKHYIHALAGYLQVRGVNLKTVSEDMLTDARIYAVNEARKATFNDESALANAIQNFGKKNLVTNFAVEGVLPFKRTPINVIKRGVEYSPIGLGKTLTKGIFDVKKGKITPTEFIDGLASGLTGTGIMLAGMFFANLGCVSGGEDDDEKSTFEKWLGKQEYAVEIMGKSYTIDWAAPACIPFFIGVELVNSMNSDKPFQLSELTNVIWNSLEPITNLSMLSGLQSTIEATRYADGSQILSTIATDALTTYATQGIPSVFGALGRTIDPKQRAWYTDKNSKWFDAPTQALANNIKSKVPGLSYTMIPKIDPWGREVSRGNIGERVLENFISPGYYSEIEYSETDTELKRVYEATGENVFPKTAPKSFKVDGETKQLTADEYVTYAKARGEYAFEYMQELMESQAYSKLTDDEKAKVINSLYEFANAKAKSTVSDYDPAEINLYKTATRWERNGKSAVNYYIANTLYQ